MAEPGVVVASSKDGMERVRDPEAVRTYQAGPSRQVPGFVDLQRMAMVLLAERVAADGAILVVGAGGGLELRALADAQPGWRFDGVDPSAEMIALAREVIGDHQDRVVLITGYVDAAPAGPFAGATCLLTLHFVPAAERVAMLREIHRRLAPGAPLVVAHHSCPLGADCTSWLARSGAFAQDGPGDPAQAAERAAMMAERLHLVSAAADEMER